MGDRLGRLERSFSSSHDTLNVQPVNDDTINEYLYRSRNLNTYDGSPPRNEGGTSNSQFHRSSLQNLPYYYADGAAKHSFSTPSFSLQPNFPNTFPYPQMFEDALRGETPPPPQGASGGVGAFGFSGGSRKSGTMTSGKSSSGGGGGQRVGNRNNNHMDALRLESVLQREVEPSPFPPSRRQFTTDRAQNRDVGFVVRGDGTGVDNVDAMPIETIQARDTNWPSSSQNSPSITKEKTTAANQVVRPKTHKK